MAKLRVASNFVEKCSVKFTVIISLHSWVEKFTWHDMVVLRRTHASSKD